MASTPANRWRFGLRRLMGVVAIAGLGCSLLRFWPIVGPFACQPIGLIFSAFGDDTVYTPGYTHRKFASIRIGMSRAEVEQAMGGPPFRVMTYPRSGREYWAFSISEGNSHHWRRAILFKGGCVHKVFNDYYID